MAYPGELSFANMRDLIEQKLQDTGNSDWETAELDLYIEEGLREISNYHPHIYKAEFNLESRRGVATSDTASALIDATNAQFLSTDVGKWVFNSDDRTWAVVTAYVSTSQLTLSKDAFPDGDENYYMFNELCTSNREFSIDSPQNPDGALGRRTFDWLHIEKIEYPILNNPPSYLKPGDWDLQENNVVRLKQIGEPPDTSESDAPDEVWVYFALKHKLSQLTTVLGKVNNVAGYAAASIAINVDDIQSSGTLYKGQEFTIDGIRGIYIADYTRTISGSALAPLTFWPPLMDAATDNDNVRFVASTLTHRLEGIFADLVAGKAAMNKASKFFNALAVGEDPYTKLYQWGKLKYEDAKSELEGLRGFTAPCVALP